MTSFSRVASAGVWIATLAALSVVAGVAGMMVLMAMSLDPADLLSAGVEPYTDALFAAAAFAGLLVAAAISLRLWHSMRFKVIGVVLTLGEVGFAAWAALLFYKEYL